MKKYLSSIILASLLCAQAFGAKGKFQNEDFKSCAELIAAGGTCDQLLNDTKIWVTANGINDTLNNAITLGSLGGGSAVGGGGLANINFVGLSTAFVVSSGTDRDAENSVGNWAAYANTPGATPVNMTGGSPVVAISRTTTVGEKINGSGSFKVVKDAANRQGNGVSVVANVPPAYRGSIAQITIPFFVISGSFSAGDLKVFAYDVTNSAVLTPVNNDVLGTGGILKMQVAIPATTAQIRIGFHFASTSAAAATFAFDDVQIGPATSFPRSEVYVDSPNGHGSSGTAIRKYTQVRQNIGFAITYNSDSVNGDNFVINEDGVYSITSADTNLSTACTHGVSVNATSLTNDITTLTYANGRRGDTDTNGASNNYAAFSITLALKTGDIVRPHQNGNCDSMNLRAFFNIVQVSH